MQKKINSHPQVCRYYKQWDGNMLKTVYVVRHGETDWNKEGKLQGWTNTHSNEKGIDQAKKMMTITS